MRSLVMFLRELGDVAPGVPIHKSTTTTSTISPTMLMRMLIVVPITTA